MSSAAVIEPTPEVPAVVSEGQHPTGRVHRYTVIQGPTISRESTFRPTEWNEEIAALYEVKAVDTTGWNYVDNFRKLNMYERWTQTCLCCGGAIMECLYNETLYFGAMEWQEYMKTLTPLTREGLEEVSEDSEGEALAEPKVESTRRKKGTFKTTVDSDSMDEVKSEYISGLTIAEVAEKFTIAPAAIREFLATEGVLRKKGQSVNSSSDGRKGFGRKKTTLDITPEIIAKALEQYPAKGVVVLAKELNVNPAELSKALKDSGASVRKGAGGTARRGRARTTLPVDEAIVEKAIKLIKTKGVVEIAKELNVNPMELSGALKAAGIVIKKGKRK